MSRSMRSMLELFSWREAFAFYNQHVYLYEKECKDELAKLHKFYLESIYVEVTSWDLRKDRPGVIIQRITIRVDPEFAGFRKGKTGPIYGNWSFARDKFTHNQWPIEPLEMVQLIKPLVWIKRRWPGKNPPQTYTKL